MNREQYRTTDEGMVEEFGRVVQLLQEAHTRVPNKTAFVRLMNEANRRGLNWVEALEYVVARREGVTHPVTHAATHAGEAPEIGHEL